MQTVLILIHLMVVIAMIGVVLLQRSEGGGLGVGQTGGFLTPTAYVVYAEKGQFFSHPAVSFHFIDASSVIGNIETFSITESFASRAEAGYTRSVHQYGNQPESAAALLGLNRTTLVEKLRKYDLQAS